MFDFILLSTVSILDKMFDFILLSTVSIGPWCLLVVDGFKEHVVNLRVQRRRDRRALGVRILRVQVVLQVQVYPVFSGPQNIVECNDDF